MRKSHISPISKKRRVILNQERIQVKLLLESCKGLCMTCGKPPDWRGLSKSHTKNRRRFILQCYSCHEGNGKRLGDHKYLE